MAAQYVNLEKCALLKCLCGSAFAAGQAPVRSLDLKISVIFGHTDKSNLICEATMLLGTLSAAEFFL